MVFEVYQRLWLFVSREITNYNSDFDPQGCLAYFFVNSNSVGSHCSIDLSFVWFCYSFEKYFKRRSWAHLLKKTLEIGFLLYKKDLSSELPQNWVSITYLSRLFKIYLEIFVSKWISPPKKLLEAFEFTHFMVLQPRFLIPVMTISLAQGLYFWQT